MSTTTEQTPTSAVATRVAELRELAATDVEDAARQAWGWIEELGDRASSDREGAEKELDELFALGNLPQGLDGATEGILVAPLIQPVVDRVARAITSVWMPWQGKSRRRRQARRQPPERRDPLDREAPVAALRDQAGPRRRAPRVRLRDPVEPGMLNPDTDVLVIDYAPVDSNPRLIIKSIRDELVEIVPGANLGKILYRQGSGYSNIGFFALRS